MSCTALDAAAPPMRSTRCDRAPDGAHRVDRGGEAEQHALDDRAGEVLRGRVRAGDAVEQPVADGRFGVRSPSRKGRRVSPPAPGAAASARRSSPARSVPSIAAPAVSTRAALSVHTSGRKPPSASAKDCDAARGVRRGAVVTGEGRAAGAERHDDVAGGQAEPEGRPHVVAGAGRDGEPGRRVPDDLGRRSDPRGGEVGAGGQPQEVAAVLAGAGRPVARAGGVTPSVVQPRDRRAVARIRPVSQSCGRTQVAARAACRALRSRPSAACSRWSPRRGPARWRRPMPGPRARRRGRGRPAPSGCRSTAGRPHDLVALVEQDHPVLLPADRDGRHPVEEAVGGRLCQAAPQWRGSTSVPSGWRHGRCAPPRPSRHRRRRACTTASTCRRRRRADGQACGSFQTAGVPWCRG